MVVLVALTLCFTFTNGALLKTIVWEESKELPWILTAPIAAYYNDKLFVIGKGDNNNDIAIMSYDNIDSISDSSLWNVFNWDADSEYGSVTAIRNHFASVQIGSMLYCAGCITNYGEMLIFDLQNEQPVSGSTYNYQMLTDIGRPCMYLINKRVIDDNEYSIRDLCTCTCVHVYFCTRIFLYTNIFHIQLVMYHK